MKAFVFINEIFRKFPALLVINTVLYTVVGFFSACSLLTIGPVIDFLIHPDLQGISPLTAKAIGFVEFLGLPVTFGSWLIYFVSFVVLTSVSQVVARHSILKTIYAVVRELFLGTFEDFFNARWYFFSSSKQGVLLNTFNRELMVVSNAFSAMAVFFAGILQLVFFLAVPFSISWQVTLISFGVALFFAVPFVLLGKVSYRLGTRNTATANHMNSVIQENMSLAKVVLGFGNQHKSIEDLGAAFDGHRDVTIKSQILDMAIPVLYRPFSVVMIVISLFAARHFGVPLSEIMVLLLALLQVAICISNLTRYKNSLDNFFPSYEQIKSLRERAKELEQSSGGRPFLGFDREIRIDGISFSYPGREPVLVDVNACIRKGEMVAFVGKSGAGKSTLIDMIVGFHQPTAGQILLDGVPLQDFDIRSYRQRVGYVPQDSVLFDMSIRDNLLWACGTATEDGLRHACRQASADEFIERLPEGYGTLVGDRGVRLSGGQVQRIALARALLRKPDLLILDEATSSLDTHSERLIQTAIENISKETTVIVIAHRLSTIKSADRIYVLHSGQVVETGTYAELMERVGAFSSMVQLQELETIK
jgi:ATP-binding cassette subfamily B protein